jgi:uncharacterized protein
MRLLKLGVYPLLALAALAAPSSERYFLVFLRPDPARKALGQEEGARIQAAHMANIQGMAARGALVAAGPFDDQPTTISGVFIMKASSLEEARRIAEQDPTVLERRNRIDAHAWLGPNGIGEEYKRLHKERPDAPEGMGVQPLFLIYRGSAWAPGAPELNEHAAYLDRLRIEGKMAMAGPTENDDPLQGMVVFPRIGVQEAQRLMAEDPAVKANVLKAEFHHWWCAEHVIPD